MADRRAVDAVRVRKEGACGCLEVAGVGVSWVELEMRGGKRGV